MFGKRTERALEAIQAGVDVSHDPTIRSAASLLALQFTGVVISDEHADKVANQLAEFSERTGYSQEVIQSALMLAEPQLSEVEEDKFHTY